VVTEGFPKELSYKENRDFISWLLQAPIADEPVGLQKGEFETTTEFNARKAVYIKKEREKYQIRLESGLTAVGLEFSYSDIPMEYEKSLVYDADAGRFKYAIRSVTLSPPESYQIYDPARLGEHLSSSLKHLSIYGLSTSEGLFLKGPGQATTNREGPGIRVGLVIVMPPKDAQIFKLTYPDREPLTIDLKMTRSGGKPFFLEWMGANVINYFKLTITSCVLRDKFGNVVYDLSGSPPQGAKTK